MSDPALFRYLVTFSKQGRLALLSHLEVTHALERMIRRAGLPFAVTQGFSPHMRIGFGSALGVGVGSTCELFDLYLVRYLPPAQVLEALRKASPEDMMPTAVRAASPRDAAASVAFPYSTYEALIAFDGGEIPALTVPETVEVRRENKPAKTLQVADYLVGAPACAYTGEGLLRVTFMLQILSTGSLRPDGFLASLMEVSGIAGRVVRLTRIRQSRLP